MVASRKDKMQSSSNARATNTRPPTTRSGQMQQSQVRSPTHLLTLELNTNKKSKIWFSIIEIPFGYMT